MKSHINRKRSLRSKKTKNKTKTKKNTKKVNKHVMKGGSNLVTAVKEAAADLPQTQTPSGKPVLKKHSSPLELQYRKGMIITNSTKGKTTLPFGSVKKTKSRSIKKGVYEPPKKYSI